MFKMIPEMSFMQRLGLWWSGAWRRWLYTFPVWMAALIAAVVVYVMMRHRTGAYPGLPALVLLGLLAFLAVNLLCVPLLGYATRNGFARHGLAAPARYGFGQAAMLGLTTWGWGILVSLALNALGAILKGLMPSPGLRLLLQAAVLCLVVVGAMYVVLPRQARRLRIQSGDPQALMESLF